MDIDKINLFASYINKNMSQKEIAFLAKKLLYWVEQYDNREELTKFIFSGFLFRRIRSIMNPIIEREDEENRE